MNALQNLFAVVIELAQIAHVIDKLLRHGGLAER